MDELRWSSQGVPVLGIAGGSGSGKTTLLEALIPRLAGRGLRIGVLKHAGHELTIDETGKDTDRLFAAGAVSVQAQDPVQRFSRRSLQAEADWRDALAATPGDLDLLLVEGYKRAPIPKVSLGGADIQTPGVIAEVGGDAERAERVAADWLEAVWPLRPTGVLLLESGHVGLGEGLEATTELPPVPGVPWPLSLLLAAQRWLPGRAWVIAPTATEACREVIAARQPGMWLVTAPPLALVEPQLHARAERLALRGAAVADASDLFEALSGDQTGG